VITNENFWIWFGGIWLAVGLAFLGIGGGIGWNTRMLDARLDAEGVPAEGVVLGKEIVSSNDGPERYQVTFRFSDARDETVRGSAHLDAATWDALVERGPIEVVYLPTSPLTYRVPGQSGANAVLVFVFPLVGAVLAAVGGFIVVNALRKRSVGRELMRSGAIAAGTVFDVGPGNLRINGIPQWELRYRFQDAQGRAHEGKCAVSQEAARSWQPGSVGRIRYDARNPRSQVWTGDRW
jgi:hypothetical protein